MTLQYDSTSEILRGKPGSMSKRAWGATIQNREEKFELKRRAVLGSAASFIRRTGFDKLSLADIAVDLHVAKPTIYYYFRNKDEIVRELMEIAVTRFFDLDSHPDDLPEGDGLAGAQQFERFIRRCVRVVSDDVGACLFMIYPSQLAPDVRHAVEAAGQPIIDMAERILRRGQTDGSIAAGNPSVIYNFLVNGLRAIPVLLDAHKLSVEQISDSFVDLMMNGIAPPERRTP
jgi:AcrR family transcriptional regulator